MLLTSFICICALNVEFTKAQQYSLREETREKILNEGLYHFTSKEVAERIIKDQYLRPTKGKVANHGGKDKVFMFAGIPSVVDFSRNLPSNLNPFISGNLEFSAVKTEPNKYELSHFKERLQDSAITYEGHYNIGADRAKAVELVLDIDEKGKCNFREKTQEEIENGYVPKKELLDYLESKKKSALRGEAELIWFDVKRGIDAIPRMLPSIYRDYTNNRAKRLAKKEFKPYEFEFKNSNGEQYSVSCNKVDFHYDKKLNLVHIEKSIGDGNEKVAYDAYTDGNLLELGNEAGAEYISKVDNYMEKNMFEKVGKLPYIGHPVYDLENGDVEVGIKKSFVDFLRNKAIADQNGKLSRDKNELFAKMFYKDYNRHHRLNQIMSKIPIAKEFVKQKRMLLPDSNTIGKYTNYKLSKYNYNKITQDEKETIKNGKENSFVPNAEINFEYKGGSKYSAMLGEKVVIKGKPLRKLIISEYSTYLSDKLDATVKLPQNYYIDDVDMKNINKKDLAKFLSNVQYNDKESFNIENKEFVGKYIGGIEVEKGRIKGTTYDDTLKENYELSKDPLAKMEKIKSVYSDEEMAKLYAQKENNVRTVSEKDKER